MKRILLPALLCLLFIIGCESNKNELKTGIVSIIPKPASQEAKEGSFEINSKTKITVENQEQLIIANRFFNQFQKVSGWIPKVAIGGNGTVRFITDVNLEPEAYVLDVKSNGINIKAASGVGFFYGVQSLKQLLPVSFFSGILQSNVTWGIPSVYINDKPAFGWRGYMLDVSRHFFNKEKVKEVIDFMAELKLNRFHWHLADDQGWRLEIKKYPKLTEIGAWRMDYNVTDETISNWFGRPVQKPGEKPTYGGFYTQEEIKEIVAYAKERYIEVIPEIDMPGHAQATIAAYPEIGCVNAAPYVATGGVVKNNTYNPGKEETFEFAENVLNEVMDLFPFKYVHIGGDECNKSQWKMDPFSQKRMKDEGLKNEKELQSYFLNRIEKIINKRDRIMIGWDEILEGGLAPNATVMSWRGEAGGIASAKEGHDVIMTPNKYCYIDLKQGHDDLEPNLGYSELLLSTSYGYKVIPNELSEEQGKHILGIQANLWTESISDWGKLTYMTFPRLFAIAESGWTSHENKNWDDFTERLQYQFKKLDEKKVRYAKSAFSPWIDHEGKEKGIEVEMKTEVNGLEIRYTLDGAEPTIESEKYTGPFNVDKTAKLKARSFQGTEAVGYQSNMEFGIHLATGKKAFSYSDKKKNLEKLTDLNYGKLTRKDARWQRIEKDATIGIDLEKMTKIKEVNFNSLRFTIAGFYPPEVVEVFGSEDGKHFVNLGSLDQTEVSKIQGRNKINFSIRFLEKAIKELKIKFKSASEIPSGHHRAGGTSAILIDEIVVN